MTVLFLIVALVVLGIDQQQLPASHEEIFDLAGATQVDLELDHCELLYIQEPPRDTDVRFFDDRVSAEQYLVVHVTQHDEINIVADVTGEESEHFSIHVENLVMPQYGRYENYLCVMEYHYPRGEVIPATTVTLTGRHMSTITAGRCEVCYISTRTEMPKGCIQPYPFVADTDDGTCSARPVWGANPLVIQTEEGHSTPAVIGMRNAELTDVNVTVLGSGFVSLTDVRILGTADITAAKGSVNIELTHAARAEATNTDGHICITDASYYIEPEEAEEIFANETNATTTSEPTTVVSDDPLAVLLALLVGGVSDVAATETEDAGANADPEQVIDESEVEDLGRRLQNMWDIAHEKGPEAEEHYRSTLQALTQETVQLEPPDRLRLLQEATAVTPSNSSNFTVGEVVHNVTNVTDIGPVRHDHLRSVLRVFNAVQCVFKRRQNLTVRLPDCKSGVQGRNRVATCQGDSSRRGVHTRTRQSGIRALPRAHVILQRTLRSEDFRWRYISPQKCAAKHGTGR